MLSKLGDGRWAEGTTLQHTHHLTYAATLVAYNSLFLVSNDGGCGSHAALQQPACFSTAGVTSLENLHGC